MFNDFVREHYLKNKATSNIKIYKVLKKIGLDSKVGIYSRDGPFSSDIGLVKWHPSKGTHWVCYIKDCYFDSYGCPPPKKLLNYLKNKHKKCVYSEYQIQKNDSFLLLNFLYIIYLVKVLGVDFKSAVLNWYYQRFSQKSIHTIIRINIMFLVYE